MIHWPDTPPKKEYSDMESFLKAIRVRSNRHLNILLFSLTILGPILAFLIRAGAPYTFSYGFTVNVSVFLALSAVLHRFLMHYHPESRGTGIVAILALEAIVCYATSQNLGIHILWFLVPILSLLFCDFRMYWITVITNYLFMVLATWNAAPYFASVRTDMGGSALAYFWGSLAGHTIEMVIMIVTGSNLCRILYNYYETLIAQYNRLDENEGKMKHQLDLISSVAGIYIRMYEMDMSTNTLTRLQHFSHEPENMETIVDTHNAPQLVINRGLKGMTDPEHQDMMLAFCDLSTVNDRFHDTDMLTLEYMNEKQKWRRARILVTARKENGSVERLLWMCEDIDKERRAREHLLVNTERAIAANEAKSSFLSNMSHEIRTPINAVLGMNEMVLRESRDENIRAYSETIRTAGNTLLSLINDILDFSRIEAGKMEILPVEYDLSAVLTDLVTMVQARAMGKGLEIRLEFDPGLPRFLYGDDVRIKQVITNILTNAVKYTKKGSVTFGMGFEDIPGEDEQIGLLVYVKDTGIGIKAEDMEKLFSKFERIEQEQNRNVEGTGLGMTITQQLLELMGSKLEVESVYGEGSTFRFRIRQKVVSREELGDYEASYRQAIEVHGSYRQKFTAPEAEVLVVDDTDTNLVVFRSLLKKTQIRITTADSGEACLRLVREKKYDMIFLDHMMSDKDGIETLHEMREEKDALNAGTPTVCLTANAISGARKRYLAEGFEDYITKPINAGRLEDMLMRYLPKEKVIPTAAEKKEEAPETSLPIWLQGCTDPDVTVGLVNCGGAEEYLRVLKGFYLGIRVKAEEIQNYLEAGDIRNYTIKVHALKSTARIIGAGALSEQARLLEEAGNKGDTAYIREHTEKLLEAYRSYREKLKPIDPLREERPDIPPEVLADVYTGLVEVAQTMDHEIAQLAVDTVKDYRLSPEDEERFQRLQERLIQMDWDGMRHILKEVK